MNIINLLRSQLKELKVSYEHHEQTEDIWNKIYESIDTIAEIFEMNDEELLEDSYLSLDIVDLETEDESLDIPEENQFSNAELSLYMPLGGVSQKVIETGKKLLEEKGEAFPEIVEEEFPEEKPKSAKLVRKFKPLNPKLKLHNWFSKEEIMEKLEITEENFERILANSRIKPKKKGQTLIYPLNHMKILKGAIKASTNFNKAKLSDSKHLLRSADAELEEDLKHDAELKALIANSNITPEYEYIQKHSQCYISGTKNGNYNAINIIAIIGDVLNNKNIAKKLVELFKTKEDLLNEAKLITSKELKMLYLSSFTKNRDAVKKLKTGLMSENLLSRYYADLALFRVPILVLSKKKIPTDLKDLLPKNIFDLSNSVRWPPTEKDKQKKAELKHYNKYQKGLYLFERLIDNNPVEFDLKKQDFFLDQQ